MNIKIKLFVIISIFLLMMVPSISAIELNAINEDYKKYNINKIKYKLETLKVKLSEKKLDIDNSTLAKIFLIIQFFFLLCEIYFIGVDLFILYFMPKIIFNWKKIGSLLDIFSHISYLFVFLFGLLSMYYFLQPKSNNNIY